MGVIVDIIDNVKKYATFKPGELKASLITIGVISFVISFGAWGAGKTVDIAFGLTNLLISIFIVAISFFARLYVQKVMGASAALQVEYEFWSFGLLIGALLVFLTNGKFWFLIPGSLIFHFMPGNRIGWVRYSLNYFGIGVISTGGPLASILMAMIFRALFDVMHNPIFKTAYVFNIVWAIWTVLPIPPSDGSRMFFGGRLLYMFGLAIVVPAGLLLYYGFPVLLSFLVSIVVSIIWWWVYYILWERYNWRGPY